MKEGRNYYRKNLNNNVLIFIKLQTMKSVTLTIFLSFLTFNVFAQFGSNTISKTIEGSIINEKNNNALPEAIITIYDDKTGQQLAQTTTDNAGTYKLNIPNRERYRLETKKSRKCFLISALVIISTRLFSYRFSYQKLYLHGLITGRQRY